MLPRSLSRISESTLVLLTRRLDCVYPNRIHRGKWKLNTDTKRAISRGCFGTSQYASPSGGMGATVCNPTVRYVSFKRATELTKRKEKVETDPERFEHHVSNLLHDIRLRDRVKKADMAVILELLEKGVNIQDHSTFLLDCCGEHMPDMKPMDRVALAQRIWRVVQDTRKESLYNFNALLQCYTYNEYSEYDPLTEIENIRKHVSRTEFSEIEPSQLTYYYALLSYCQRGDLTNAVKVLNLVKKKDLPVDEKFFNALILGNARSGDLSTAKEIINLMKSTHVEPSSKTYKCLLQAYIEADKLTELEKLCNTAAKEVRLSGDDIIYLTFVAALSGNRRALGKVLAWEKPMPIEQLENYLTSLVHRGYPEEALKIFLEYAPKITTLQSNLATGRFVIKELVYSKANLSTIISVCEALEERGYNNHALVTAAEYSLKGKRFDLSFSIFKMMKEKDIEVRPHYFWPIIINLFEAEGTRGITKVLQNMQTLDVKPDWETKYDYLLPKLFLAFEDPVDVAKFLKDSELSLSSGSLKAVLMFLLKQNRLKDASKFCTSLPGTIAQPNPIVDHLLQCVLDFDAREAIMANIELAVPILIAISKNVPHEDKTDYVGKFIIRFIESIGIGKPDLVKLLIKGIEDAQLPVSEDTADILTNQAHLHCSLVTNPELVLNDGVAGRVVLHPREMDVKGLESHAEELKAKQLNARGTLRRIFIKYCQEKDFTKALKLKEEFEQSFGGLTLGMEAALMGLYIHQRQLQPALDLFQKLKLAIIEPDGGEKWKLDCYKIYDLVSLMAENEMGDEAYTLLEESISLPNLSVPEDLKSITRNVVRMLENFSKYEGSTIVTDYVRLVVDLLLKNNMVEPCNPVLGCVIKHYVVKKDVETALELFTEYAKKYKLTPGRLQLAYAVLNNEVLLAKYTGICVSIWGEVNTKHSLAYAKSDTGDIQGASKLFKELRAELQFTNILKQCEYLGERHEVKKMLNLINALSKAEMKLDTSKLYLIALKSCKRSDSNQDLKLVLGALQEHSGYIPSHVLRFADEIKCSQQQSSSL